METHQILALSVIIGAALGSIDYVEHALSGGVRVIGAILNVAAAVLAWGWVMSFSDDAARAATAFTGVVAGGLAGWLLASRRQRSEASEARPAAGEPAQPAGTASATN